MKNEDDPKKKVPDEKKKETDKGDDWPVRIMTSGDPSISLPGTGLGIDPTDGSITINIPGTPISFDTDGK